MREAFYTQERAVHGVRIRAHAVVSNAALDEAERRVRRLLDAAPRIRSNLRAAGAELHIIGRDQRVTDLPMYRHMRGVPFEGDLTMDERGRGYGGLFACTAEEALLGLSTRRHADGRDVCTHELAHTVADFGLDPALRERIAAQHRAAVAEGLWDAYAGTNPAEFWAELTMWWVGSRGDYGRIRAPAPGATWFQRYDPASYALLDDVYRGRAVPDRFAWVDLAPTRATASESGAATSVVIVNRTETPLELLWVDYAGAERPYGWVAAHGVSAQSTYVTHLWRLKREGVVVGTFAAVEGAGRVLVAADRRVA